VLRPRPAPSTPPQRSCGRCQKTDVRCQTAPSPTCRPALVPAASGSDLPLIAPGNRCANTAPPMLAHRHAYPCSRPNLTSCEVPAGPASRSRLASRCQKGRGQRTDVGRATATSSNATRPQKRHSDDPTRDARGQNTPVLQAPTPHAGPRRLRSSDLGHLTSG
jgi:hypothetical protein